MYVSSVFRGKVTVFLSRVAILKAHLCLMVTEIRAKILSKKCSKVQSYIRSYLL